MTVVVEGQSGTSESLTEAQAAEGFAGLLAAEDAARAGEDSEQQGEVEGDDLADEDTPEESRDEPEDSEDEDEDAVTETDEDDEPAPATPKTRKVKVDGAEVEVTDDELLKGYSRTADYTRKTQALAAEKTKVEAENAAVRAEREKYKTTLDRLEKLITSAQPTEPNWAKIQQETPDEFPSIFANWQVQQQQLKAVQAERDATEAKMAADQRSRMTAEVQAESEKLLEAVPAWKDAEKALKGKQDVAKYAKSLGFSDEQIGSMYDHREVVLLRKAMLYDRAKQKGVAPVVPGKKPAAPVLTPGPANRPKGERAAKAERSLRQLAKSHSVEDAAAAFFHSGLLD